MMLHTKYIKALGLVVSEKKIFSCFTIQAYVKHVTPWGGPIFSQQGHNLNKLGRGSLDDATNQISRLYALWFKTRNFLKSYLENLFLACVT